MTMPNMRMFGMVSSAATYTITPAAASIDEGSALTINVGGRNIPADTYYYTINHITSVSGDFSASSGSFSIAGNAGSFTVTPTADVTTEGAETFTVSIRSGSIGGTILATSSSITINDTSTTPVALYAFTSHTFTNASKQGRFGPTTAESVSAYSATSWASNVNFFTGGAYQGYQKWTVPATGSYTITACGASALTYGGRGRIIRSTISLTQGEFLIICVGQVPYRNNSGGGAGGSFVVRQTGNVALLIAGGGGGCYSITKVADQDANATTSGNTGGGESNAGTSGNGGSSPVNNSPYAGSGGGFLSNGGDASNGGANNGGRGFNAGLTGGASNNGDTYAAGGFGGGGGTHGNTGGGGGGGGYSGGGGQGHYDTGGGGAGSYSITSITDLGYNTISTAGYVIIAVV